MRSPRRRRRGKLPHGPGRFSSEFMGGLNAPLSSVLIAHPAYRNVEAKSFFDKFRGENFPEITDRACLLQGRRSRRIAAAFQALGRDREAEESSALMQLKAANDEILGYVLSALSTASRSLIVQATLVGR